MERDHGHESCEIQGNCKTHLVNGDGPYFDMDLQGQGQGNCCNEEFEFRVSVSKAPGVSSPVDLCPADELFYKGQLLPLHMPPRLRMVQSMETPENSITTTNTSSSEAKGDSDSVNSRSFWSKDSSGSSDSTCSRDSSESSHDSSECNSHPEVRSLLTNPGTQTRIPAWKKSAAKLKVPLMGLKKSSKVGMDEKALQTDPCSEKIKFKTTDLTPPTSILSRDSSSSNRFQKNAYFSYPNGCPKQGNNKGGSREVIRKYFKMIKPLYEKISNKYDQVSFLGQFRMDECGNPSADTIREDSEGRKRRQSLNSSRQASLSGNFRFGRKSSGSCPPSLRSSPNHSGVLTGLCPAIATSDSTMDELQSAIQGAIAHCKKSNAVKCETAIKKDSKVTSCQ